MVSTTTPKFYNVSLGNVTGAYSPYAYFFDMDESKISNPTDNDAMEVQVEIKGSANYGNNRQWESQVVFKNADGKYAIRSTNCVAGSGWRSDAFITISDDGTVKGVQNATQAEIVYKWTIEPVYEAEIGDVKYKTLADAVAAAKSNDEITLLTDIDLTGQTWTPFGATPETAFQGTIDGNNKTIKGLSGGTDKAGKEPFGLVAYATGNVTVKDLTFTDVDINSGEYASAVMGLYIGAKGEDEATYEVNLENIVVESGTISGTDKPGAILGCTYSSSYTGTNKNITFNFINCTNKAAISGTGRVGGIAGAISGQFAKDPGSNKIKIMFNN